MGVTSTRISRFVDLSSMPTLTNLDLECVCVALLWELNTSLFHFTYSERHWDMFYCYYQHRCLVTGHTSVYIRDIMEVKVIKDISHFVPDILQVFNLVVKFN